jgi:hypothetical protein
LSGRQQSKVAIAWATIPQICFRSENEKERTLIELSVHGLAGFMTSTLQDTNIHRDFKYPDQDAVCEGSFREFPNVVG